MRLKARRGDDESRSRDRVDEGEKKKKDEMKKRYDMEKEVIKSQNR